VAGRWGDVHGDCAFENATSVREMDNTAAEKANMGALLLLLLATEGVVAAAQMDASTASERNYGVEW